MTVARDNRWPRRRSVFGEANVLVVGFFNVGLWWRYGRVDGTEGRHTQKAPGRREGRAAAAPGLAWPRRIECSVTQVRQVLLTTAGRLPPNTGLLQYYEGSLSQTALFAGLYDYPDTE